MNGVTRCPRHGRPLSIQTAQGGICFLCASGMAPVASQDSEIRATDSAAAQCDAGDSVSSARSMYMPTRCSDDFPEPQTPTIEALLAELAEQARLQSNAPPKPASKPLLRLAPPPRFRFVATAFHKRLSVRRAGYYLGDVAEFISGWRAYPPGDGYALDGVFSDRDIAAEALANTTPA